MKYIKFWNPITMSFHDGMLVQEDKEHFRTLYPIHYLWLAKTGREAEIGGQTLNEYEKRNYSYVEANFKNPYEGKEWMFGFPLLAEDEQALGSISNFFEHYFDRPQRPFYERLDAALEITKRFLSDSACGRLSDFVLKNDPEAN